MKLHIVITSIYCLFSFALFAQNRTRVYYINKINPYQIFNNPKQYAPGMKLQSAGVEIYKYDKSTKADSVFFESIGFHCWGDSIAFWVDVPNDFLANGASISMSPRFYLGGKIDKGGLPDYLDGKEQSVVQINLKLKSEPSGAKVFLVPKLYWERNPLMLKCDSKTLFPFLVSQGVTTVTIPVQEYVYIVVFLYKGKHSIVQTTPNHLQILDSVYAKFN